MMNELITIIVPAYNVEKYIRQCLDSLVFQSLSNHKVILVNDGSTDNTPSICEEYAAKYPSLIQYISQENRGLGAARNVGIAHVNTPYLTFLDSDDFQDIHFVEIVTGYIEKLDVTPDIVFTMPSIYDQATGRVVEWYDKADATSLFKYDEEAIAPRFVSVLENPWVYSLEPNANRRILSTEFVKRINFSFPEGVKWEDIEPHFYSLHMANNLGALFTTGFYYRINSGSQITAGTGVTRMDMLSVLDAVISRATLDNWPDIEGAFIVRLAIKYLNWCIDVINNDYRDAFMTGTRALIQKVPKSYFAAYFNTCSPHKRTEKLMLKIIKSPFYKMYGDYRFRERLTHIINRLRK